jgi:DNA-binding winged helix-turn-helix (wHTH) protein
VSRQTTADETEHATQQAFRVGDRVVYPAEGALVVPGRGTVYLEPKLMEVLVHLAGAGGSLVSRRELMDAHWHPGAECDAALNRVICALRRVLEDDCRHPQFVGTVYKHGYRLLVRPEPVVPGESMAEAARAAEEQPASPREPESPLPVCPNLFAELRRRRVFRVATAYAVSGWLIVQIAETTFDPLGVPAWCLKLLMLLVVLGFPPAVALAWAVQITPAGPVLEPPAYGRTGGGWRRSWPGIRVAVMIIIVLLGGGVLLADRLPWTSPAGVAHTCPIDGDAP